MDEYVSINKDNEGISVCFYIEKDKPFEIGEKMCEINEDAYMNGYNWEMFFEHYLKNNAPDILENMETDPEAGLYAVYYDLSEENEARAEKFAEIIRSLVENEEQLYDYVSKYGDEIEWD